MRIQLSSAGTRAIDRVLAREAVAIKRVARAIDQDDLTASLRVIEQIIIGFERRTAIKS
jgi:hypothetical protein